MLNSTVTIVKVRKVGEKKLKKKVFLRENSVTSYKTHPDPTAFNFPARNALTD